MNNGFKLKENEVHVWSFDLDVMPTHEWKRVLSLEELKRADALKHPDSCRNFLLSRYALRHILALYLSEEPHKITIKIDNLGKPYLAGHERVYFNLSHSENLGVCAIAHMDVGIDVEKLREVNNLLQLTARFFGKEDQEILVQTRKESLNKKFFELWTQKESFLKAKGSGLRGSLDSPIKQLIAGESLSFSLVPLQLRDDYVGTLAVCCANPQVVFHKWTIDV